jgi:hypothetical protein
MRPKESTVYSDSVQTSIVYTLDYLPVLFGVAPELIGGVLPVCLMVPGLFCFAGLFSCTVDWIS